MALIILIWKTAEGQLLESSVGGHPKTSYASFVHGKEALKGAKFGLPWKRLWETASKGEAHKLEYETLRAVTERIRAGAEVIEGTNFPSAEEIIPPTDWDW